ncbi:MAG: monovalent cation/H+ antiporter subunit D family protein [Candidatus Omnitrophica bacterium]|nr:monovalent cation/H+ antiporter subunit D family protein [Candidatus Omnitrophota bacterium]
MIFLFTVLPLLSSFLIVLLGKRREYLSWFLSIFSASLLLVFSISTIFLNKFTVVYAIGGWGPPFGICFVLDGLSCLFLVVINLIATTSLLFSFSYMKKFDGIYLYYTLFCLLLAGLNGVVISGDLFNIFVFLEISSLASYALISFGRQKEELEASFKYSIMGNLASIFILLAIAFIFANTGSLNLANISRSLGQTKYLLNFALLLLIVGFGIKAALVPFHGWLADAHPAAPSPISAMLSGVVIKIIGVYGLIRIVFNIIGFDPKLSMLLILLGIISMIVGVLLAIGQWDFKRLLAYHSISQIGYVIFGIGLGTPLGITGGLFHLLNHSIFKSLLFLNAGAVEYRTGLRDLKKLKDIAKSMPLTSNTSLIASLSIAGIPPFCGFWSKFFIILAAFSANKILGGFFCIFVSLITLASFLKVQKYVFLDKNKNEEKKILEVPLSMASAMIFLAILCILIGLFFLWVTNNIVAPAVDVLLDGKVYALKVLNNQL